MCKMELDLSEMSSSSDDDDILEAIQTLHRPGGNIWNEMQLKGLLLDYSEDASYSMRNQTSKKEPTEGLVAWQNTAAYAKYVIPKKRKQPKAQEEAFDLDPYTKWKNMQQKPSFQEAPHWKACVEPVTYRYIPYNGKYRVGKSSSKSDSGRNYFRRSALADKLTPEQKQLQREIQRELRQEFEKSKVEKSKGHRGHSDEKCIPEEETEELADAKSSKSNQTAQDHKFSKGKNTFDTLHPRSAPSSPVKCVPSKAKCNSPAVSDSGGHTKLNLPAVYVPVALRSTEKSMSKLDSISSYVDALDSEMRKGLKAFRKQKMDTSNNRSNKVDKIPHGDNQYLYKRTYSPVHSMFSVRHIPDQMHNGPSPSSKYFMDALLNKGDVPLAQIHYTTAPLELLKVKSKTGATLGASEPENGKVTREDAAEQGRSEHSGDSKSQGGYSQETAAESLKSVMTISSSLTKPSLLSGANINAGAKAKIVHSSFKAAAMGKEKPRAKKSSEEEKPSHDLVLPHISGKRISVDPVHR